MDLVANQVSSMNEVLLDHILGLLFHNIESRID